MVPVKVEGVGVMPPELVPMMLLHETSGERRWLVISIGAPEAEALMRAKEHVEEPRPSTVELIVDVLAAFGRRVVRVEVVDLRDGVYFADLVLDSDLRISARPSDAVALGLRAGVPVTVADPVFDLAGVHVAVEGLGGDTDEPSQEREIEQFRRQLEQSTPEDFKDFPEG